MRFHLLMILAIAVTFGPRANADSTFGYSLGVSLQNTVVPGSMISINAFLLNTGSTPIVFAPSFPGGPPSAEGGSLPFGGVSSGGDWNILGSGFSFGDFSGQFAGLVVAPGSMFQFSMGTFHAPTGQPLGATATTDLNFGIDFTDSIEGNLLAMCNHGTCDFDHVPQLSFTLGDRPSSSNTSFFQGAIVDHQHPVSVPEPRSWEMFGITAIAMATCLHRIYRRA